MWPAMVYILMREMKPVMGFAWEGSIGVVGVQQVASEAGQEEVNCIEGKDERACRGWR
jgi:hypothetical protein